MSRSIQWVDPHIFSHLQLVQPGEREDASWTEQRVSKNEEELQPHALEQCYGAGGAEIILRSRSQKRSRI